MSRRKRSRYRTGSHESPKAGIVAYRSSYERRACVCFDADPEIVSYEYEQLKIAHKQWTLLGTGEQFPTARSYTPDFVLKMSDGRVRIVELKSEFGAGTGRNAKKLKLAEAFCERVGWTYELWTLKDVIERELALGIEGRDHAAYLEWKEVQE